MPELDVEVEEELSLSSSVTENMNAESDDVLWGMPKAKRLCLDKLGYNLLKHS